jgi:hypothetical protein
MGTLSEKLESCNNSGDFGKALEGYSEQAKELENIAYLVNCMLISEGDRNFGDAENWKHRLKQANEKYFDRTYQ